MPGQFRIFWFSTIVLLGAGGGGGGSAVTTAPAHVGSAPAASGPPTAGTLTLTIGNGSSTGSAKTRSPLFISTHTASLGILVGTASEVFVDVSGTSPNCVTGPITLGGLRTCTIPVTAPAGQPTILLATFDAANGGGLMLAQGSAAPTIVAGQTWSASATMAPVLSQLSGGSLVFPSGIPFVIGTPGTATATIFGDDPDGTLIPATTTSFASGVTIASSDAHVTVSPTLWPGPATPITLTYDGSASVSPTVNLTFSKGTTTLSQIPFSPVGTPFTEFAIPTPASGAQGITSGPDGALWFVEQTGNNIGRITTTGAITEIPVTTANSLPSDMVTGPDGNLWFTEENSSSNQIGRINPTTHAITEFATGITPIAEPFGITSNPDGTLYFTEFSGNKIGRITTGGTVTEFAIATPGSEPEYIVTGPDGALWFTQFGSNQIGRMPAGGGTVTEFSIPTGSSTPSGITVGPDGALWFLEQSAAGNKVGRITTAGVITNEFVIPTAAAHPMTITTGADGNLWFSENNSTANKIARMTTAGVFTEFVIPTANSGPCSVTLGPDNNIWFAENNNTGNKIGRI
jgi:virginiamycin B lyase